MIIRKLGEDNPKILIFQGSPRREDSCANQNSKSSKVVDWVVDKYSPFVDFDVVDLSVGKVKIQPCKGCVSTSGGFHCHWFCSCYSKGNKDYPDLMYEADIYQKLEECDGFLVVSPIHWYSVSTQVKAMFDRLVCANLTITKEEALKLFGKGNIKTADLTSQAELSERYKSMLKNHLQGKWASFYVHGDDGAADYDGHPPNIQDKMWDVRNCVMPLVYQCRYSGMNCPDELVEAFYVNKGLKYSEANMFDNPEMYSRMDGLMDRMLTYIKSGSSEKI
jgi:multimeric flavodoxin WrbA